MSAEWTRTQTRVFSGISNLGEILGWTARFLCGLLVHLQLQVINSSLFSSLTLSNCRWFNLAILKLSCLRLIALWLWWRPREKQQAVSLAISRRMPTIVKTINSSKYDWSIYILEIYFDTLIKWQLVCQMITWSDPEDFNYASHSIPPEDFSAKFLLTTLGYAWGLIEGLELRSFLVIKLRLDLCPPISKDSKILDCLTLAVLSYQFARSSNTKTVLKLGFSPSVSSW